MKRPRAPTVALCLSGLIMVGFGAALPARGAHAAHTSQPADPPGVVQAASLLPTTAAAPAPAPQQRATIEVPRGSLGTPLLPRLRSLLGLLVLTFIAWLLSTDRSRVPWRVVIWGLTLQLLFALFILKTPVGGAIFDSVNRIVVALLGYTNDGASFVFGGLVKNLVPVGTGDIATGSFQQVAGQVANTGASFAFSVLPTIIFFCSLMTVLYHLGIMQVVVKGVAWVMQRTMHTSGAETLSAAGNIFVGQTEAPLLIKPFVETMTVSELMAVMTAGFATVAGGVMAAYVGMLLAYFPDIAGHLLAASVMSAPAALVVAKLMVPETGSPETMGKLEVAIERPDVNVIDAAARGASEGLFLALNVGAMLLAFVAIIYLLNGLLGWGAGLVGIHDLTLQKLLGWVLAPLAWLMGVSWHDAPAVASLLGMKTVLNEFYAYLQLASDLGSGMVLQPRSIIIVSYALCGFANFSSIAIQLGGIGGLAPSRRHDLSRLGMRAMIGGTIAAFMTATVAGMVM
jgi:concentrative nucleoside transporter, CNT family